LRSGEDGDFGEVDVFGDGGEEGDGFGDVFGLEDVDLSTPRSSKPPFSPAQTTR
jgi:hypothetical protein